MVSLKDMLAEESAKRLLAGVGRGDIIRMRLTEQEGITPKEKGANDRHKYFVVLGKTEDGCLIGFVVINSSINKNLSPILKRLHYPMQKAKYPFLKHDSFVYCGELKEITFDNFYLRYDCETFGRLDEEDLRLVVDAVKTSPAESPKHLKKFGLL